MRLVLPLHRDFLVCDLTLFVPAVLLEVFGHSAQFGLVIFLAFALRVQLMRSYPRVFLAVINVYFRSTISTVIPVRAVSTILVFVTSRDSILPMLAKATRRCRYLGVLELIAHKEIVVVRAIVFLAPLVQVR